MDTKDIVSISFVLRWHFNFFFTSYAFVFFIFGYSVRFSVFSNLVSDLIQPCIWKLCSLKRGFLTVFLTKLSFLRFSRRFKMKIGTMLHKALMFTRCFASRRGRVNVCQPLMSPSCLTVLLRWTAEEWGPCMSACSKCLMSKNTDNETL